MYARMGGGIAVALTIAAVLLPTGSAAAYTPCPEQLAFYGSDGTYSGLWKMNEDGSGVQFVQPTGNQAFPSITPDGSQIVYGDNGGIYENGSQVWNTYPGANAEFPRVGPDGTTVVFSSVLPGDSSQDGGNIHSVQTDGTGLNDLVDWVSWQGQPDLSPDGSKLVLSSEGTPGGDRLNDMSQLEWTGQVIAHPELFVTNADGSGARQLTDVGTFIRAEFPRFSPDGTKIAFVGTEGVYGQSVVNSGIYVMDVSSGAYHYVTDGQNPDWSPDGSSLVYSRSGILMRVNSDGSNATTISMSPSSLQGYNPSYRHASTSVTYTAPDCSTAPPPPPAPGGSGSNSSSTNSANSTSTGNASATNTSASAANTSAPKALLKKGGPQGDPLYRQPKP